MLDIRITTWHICTCEYVERSNMAYVKPEAVVSPRNRWRLLSVLYDGGPNDGENPGWAVAEGQWEWEEADEITSKKRRVIDDVLGIRWNGQDGEENGTPQTWGNPTWFILPDELSDVVREAITEIKKERRKEKKEKTGRR